LSNLRIAGAGLAGLLAGRMLAHRKPSIFELQSQLPNNHTAVRRFRSAVVGDVLGIPFKPVQVIKGTVPWLNPVADALAYSFKNTGASRSDRSIAQAPYSAERWIAPANLVERMAEGCLIAYGADAFDWGYFPTSPIVSTIPMPQLMSILEYPGRDVVEFKYRGGVNYKATIADCDAYVSLLVPDPEIPFSRISITGDELIVESYLEKELDPNWAIYSACDHLGIGYSRCSGIEHHTSRYAKIIPIPEDIRRDFMFWATDRHNVFSLGRFATWRPGLLTDDLVKDIRKIDTWLDRAGRYEAARSR
jgi:hypothetical protein